MTFVSDGALARHKEYLENLRYGYSLLCQRLTSIKDKNLGEISRQKLDFDDKQKAMYLLGEIRAHEIYFNSFSERAYRSSDRLGAEYGNCSVFLNKLYALALSHGGEYLGIFDIGGRIRIFFDRLAHLLLLRGECLLLVDLYEHAYYEDFGFNYKEYLLSALPYLALNRLDGKKA